ncbi:aspartate aminotransferase [Paecilomyces variotii No. 5]|uniref:Aspartate aminotransferase n=1 Tax=Byssochlamys spectabilis (strain No. 5 / NBRC 109023) TaxID=1356009 RepID=V5HWJ0_BYSSN|nr:aspartate aminotransferase [Paecilomyces variotii No. 5]
MFEDVQPGPKDPMFDLKKLADNDTSPQKIDLGVGVYRNEDGGYHELQVVEKAKKILDETNPGHDYELTTGNPSFLNNAAALLFEENSKTLKDRKIASVQTISGTGACHLAALFLRRCKAFAKSVVYVGTPAWGNYEPLLELVGFEVDRYTYYDPHTHAANFKNLLDTVVNAPQNSIFVLQGCCHNPTGADLSQEQWKTLAEAMKKADAFPLFDIAYQGLGASPDNDAYGIQLFAEKGFEMVVCQSFSKNFGLYGERCGVLHVVTAEKTICRNVHDQLRSLIRWEFSSSPAYGSRLVNIILEDPDLRNEWLKELSAMRNRLVDNRKKLYRSLVDMHKTPGSWGALLTTTGLFCYLPLMKEQIVKLREKYHIYLPENGRINVAGLNPTNLGSVASAINEVLRDASKL